MKFDMLKKFRLSVALLLVLTVFLVSSKGQRGANASTRRVEPPKLLYRATAVPVQTGIDLNSRGDVIGTWGDKNNYYLPRTLLLWKDKRVRTIAQWPYFLPKDDQDGDLTIRTAFISDDGRITGRLDGVYSGAISYGRSFLFSWNKSRLQAGSLRIGRRFDNKGRKVGSEDIGAPTWEVQDDPNYHNINSANFDTSEESRSLRRYRHAILYDAQGKGRDLGVLTGDLWSRADAMNNKGQVVGTSASGFKFWWRYRAVLWQNGVPTALEGGSAKANDINERGRIVGQWLPKPNQSRAVLWKNGKMQDLNTVLAVPPDVVFQEAVAINDRGQILVNGENTKTQRPQAFVLTPFN